MNLAWRAWTIAGKFNSAENCWEDLPDDGIYHVVVYFQKNGRVLRRPLSGQDYYFCQRREGRADLIGSSNHAPSETRRRYPGAVLKRGMWTDDYEYARISDEAMEAREWPSS